MARLRRTTLAVLVWLTAVMTLVAGAPRLVCRCPDGHTKPFCFGFTSEKSSCCCGGSCCSKEGGSCCCHNSETVSVGEDRPGCRQPSESPHDAETQVGHTCCSKTLVHPEGFLLTTAKVSGGSDLTSGPLVASQLEVAISVPSDSSQILWHGHRLPPPDLIITLQHLTI